MFKRFILIIFTSIASLITIAQSQADIQVPKIVPPSPDAAALGKYGQIPVDKSTGTPQISVPLYEIKTPRFTLPISLSYHTSIKVEEVASWVGLGWALNAGGVITRSINRFPDDGYYGFLTNHSQIKKAADIQWPADIVYISRVVEKTLDTEPDNFFYNFNNHSGAFVFGDDTKPVLVPYEPIKLNFNATSKNFDITDEQGNTYYFIDKEMAISQVSADMSGISSWYLTKMISADLTDTIQFNYTTDATAYLSYNFSFSQDLSDVCAGGQTTLRQLVKNVNSTEFYPVRISSIQFKGGKVDFITKTGRLDEGPVLLDSVIISNLNPATNQYSRLKSFKLLSDYFHSTYGNPSTFFTLSDADNYRLKLIGLQENDLTGSVVKTHQFDYHAGMLPHVHSFAQDKWGYFNGKISNQTLLESRQVLFQQNGTTPEQIAEIGGSEGADRSVSENDMRIGVLEKITYPTKGYTVFDFESNKQQTATQIPGGMNVTALGAGGFSGTLELVTQTYTPSAEMLGTGGAIFTVKLSSGTPATSPLPYIKIVRVSDGVKIYNSLDNGSANTVIDNLSLRLLNIPYC